LRAPSTHGLPQNDESAIATLAQQTDTDQAAVKHLYDEEIAVLQGTASVKNFIGIIAARRVRQRLTAAQQHSRAQVTLGTPIAQTGDSGAGPTDRQHQDPQTVNARATRRSRTA
jgi:hypothetical protein